MYVSTFARDVAGSSSEENCADELIRLLNCILWKMHRLLDVCVVLFGS